MMMMMEGIRYRIIARERRIEFCTRSPFFLCFGFHITLAPHPLPFTRCTTRQPSPSNPFSGIHLRYFFPRVSSVVIRSFQSGLLLPPSNMSLLEDHFYTAPMACVSPCNTTLPLLLPHRPRHMVRLLTFLAAPFSFL